MTAPCSGKVGKASRALLVAVPQWRQIAIFSA